ncbi:hypothetical protein OH413_24170, partial [Salmonella enterica]|nr:hypothetical protein [Salmonella enterica]
LLVIVGFQHSRRLAVSEAARSELEEESARLDRMVRARTRQLSALASHLQRVTEDEKTRLARELHEELGLDITASTRWHVLEHDYPHAYVRLHFCKVTGWTGDPVGREGQAFSWE